MADEFLIGDVLARTQSPAAMNILRTLGQEDQMALVLPFVGQSSLGVTYTREGVRPGSQWISDTTAAVTETSKFVPDEVVTRLRRRGGNVDLDDILGDTSEGAGSAGMQISKKAAGVWDDVMGNLFSGKYADVVTVQTGAAASITAGILSYVAGPGLDSVRSGPGTIKYTHAGTLWSFRAPGDLDFGTPVAVAADAVVILRSQNRSKYVTVSVDVSGAVANAEANLYFTSSATTESFDGIHDMMDPGRVIPSVAAAGDDFSLATLDLLHEQVKVKRNLAYVLPPRLITMFRQAMTALGGVTMAEVSGRQVMTYNGTPVLQNDRIPTNESKGGDSTLTSAYLASFDASEGLSMAVLNVGNPLDPMADPVSRPVLGFRVRDLSIGQATELHRYRVLFYGCPVLKDHRALARAKEIKTAFAA